MKKCGRCGGQMICRWHYGGSEKYWSWDCLQCGNSEDGLILRNRMERPGGGVMGPGGGRAKLGWGKEKFSDEMEL
jgi:hypothetical protein